MILVSGSTDSVSRFRCDALGELMRPGNGNMPTGPKWAADNGAYAGFEPDAFWSMLGKLRGLPGCLWVAAPDAVADSRETAQLFRAWEPMLHGVGFPVAYVLQDGETAPPWDSLECLFVGGSTEYKDGPEAARWAREAKRRGKLLHVGRVNTEARMRKCVAIGADSIDGTTFSRYGDIKIPWGLKTISRIEYRHRAQTDILEEMKRMQAKP